MLFTFESNPKRVLNKAWLKKPVARPDLERLRDSLLQFASRLDLAQPEEHAKNLLADLLKATYYGTGYDVNIQGEIDLTIAKNGKAQVLVETKRPGKTTEMMTTANPNAKALQQALLYFLDERLGNGNTEIKTLIVTDMDTWFVFDARDFEALATNDRALCKAHADFRAKGLPLTQTSDFYSQIAKPWLETHPGSLPSTVIDLAEVLRGLRSRPDNLSALVPLYKFLHPAHLLREAFGNDSNSLDKNFYGELLYWMGLEEAKVRGKAVIRRPAVPQGASLIELIRERLLLDEKVPADRTTDDVALELALLWVNRLLFLKLLESQLGTYHPGDATYRFMRPGALQDFDELYSLFFDVLPKTPAERSPKAAERWARVPYLNSSLFERSDTENRVLTINQLDNHARLPVYARSILKDEQRRATAPKATLDYLLSFLDAFDFSSEGTGEVQEAGKSLINASVLGLIFEKINGYKEGAFFTPGYITEYMARQSVHSAILTKFRQAKGWDCADLTDLHNHLVDTKTDRNDANALVNSLKILDPAVGSGHFLVSVLNELIAAKSELGLLTDKQGKRLSGYRAVVEADELFLLDEDSEFVSYRAPFGANDRQRVWETIFAEKRTLIENCLFGVDLNPNSVQICKLRLWIELLKHAYYTPESGYLALETLPNLDIKIRCGNSLVSRYALTVPLNKIGKPDEGLMTQYLQLVRAYQETPDKRTKAGIEAHIAGVKKQIVDDLEESSPLRHKHDTARGKVASLEAPDLFEPSAGEAKALAKKLEAARKELATLDAQLDDDARNPIYRNSFEWRFEFPEVLHPDTGDFVGFDVVIGNPPYIRIQDVAKDQADFIKSRYTTATGNFDIYVNFVERARQLLCFDALMSMILPNKWFRTDYGQALRSSLAADGAVCRIINFGHSQVFDEATIYTCILVLTAQRNQTFALARSDANKQSLESAVFRIEDHSNLGDDAWTLGTSDESLLMSKLSGRGARLLDLPAAMSRGSSTGADTVFMVDKALVDQHGLEAGCLRVPVFATDFGRYHFVPASGVHVIYPYLEVENDVRILSEDELKSNFPGTYAYLSLKREELEKRKQTGAWYGYSAARNLELHNRAQIAIPLLASRGEFALIPGADRASLCPMAGGGFTITMDHEASLHPAVLLAILNSSLLFWALGQLSNVFRGGWITCTKQYFGELPIAVPNSEISSNLEALVTQILAAKTANPGADTTALEAEIDALVYQLYGLAPEDIAIVEGRTREK